MKKKYFYENTSYLVFQIMAIIILVTSITLNAFKVIDEKIINTISSPLAVFLIGAFIYQMYCSFKDKRLRELESKIPKVSIEPVTDPFAKPGEAIINIDDFKYFIQSPFVKEGVSPGTNDTFYSYLSNSRTLIKPIAKKMVRWLKKDMKLADTTVNEYQLCNYFRDLRVFDYNNPLFLFYAGNEKLNLIFAIELLERNDKIRGLEHISALINAASAHERVHYAGGGLLDAFDLFKNAQMMPKISKQRELSGIAFCIRNKVSCSPIIRVINNGPIGPFLFYLE